MVNMIFFANLSAAIIATALLGFVLALNVRGGVRAFDIQFEAVAAATSGTENFSVLGTIAANVFCQFFLIVCSVAPVIFCDLFFILGAIEAISLRYLSFVFGAITRTKGGYSLFVSLVIPAVTCLAYILNAAGCSFVARKVCDCGRFGFAAPTAPLLRLDDSTAIVSLTKTIGNTFDDALTFLALLRNGCLLTASALAVAIGDFIRGIMGVHQNLQFCLPKPRAFRDAAGHFLLVATPVIVAQEGGLCQT